MYGCMCVCREAGRGEDKKSDKNSKDWFRRLGAGVTASQRAAEHQRKKSQRTSGSL